MLLHDKLSAKSSAYRIDVNISETLGRSLIANKNNKLPRTEPCGTDLVICKGGDKEFPIRTD